ncbi:platelet factor 4-like [Orycteropus afer afer]|uniref:Platelet factor 4-like n=1 Tax=Orycteropus afer afer TaxID=1230840 RepID=A0AC54Z6T4_ORYAF|nr:platelet factor 4-like [Orycteropus afer afer]
MNHQRSSGAWHAGPSPLLLLLQLLLLPAVVAFSTSAITSVDPSGEDSDLGCMCVKTTFAVHPKHVTSLELIKAGLHCPKAQLIATLKNGRKICLDQQAPLYKKIIRKLLEN